MFKFMQILSAVAALTVAVPVFAQTYAGESADWGIQPTTELTTTYHAKTPTTVSGAKTILTDELKKLLDGPNPPLLFDVLNGGSEKLVIKGAIFLGRDAGDGQIFAAEKARFANVLAAVTDGDKSRPMAFYCLSSKCWLSHNAVLRAISEGYRNVMWYRGGIKAWQTAGYPLEKAHPYTW